MELVQGDEEKGEVGLWTMWAANFLRFLVPAARSRFRLQMFFFSPYIPATHNNPRVDFSFLYPLA